MHSSLHAQVQSWIEATGSVHALPEGSSGDEARSYISCVSEVSWPVQHRRCLTPRATVVCLPPAIVRRVESVSPCSTFVPLLTIFYSSPVHVLAVHTPHSVHRIAPYKGMQLLYDESLFSTVLKVEYARVYIYDT